MKDVNSTELKFHLTANAIKFIAIVAMTIDHIAYGFIQYDPPTVLSRFTHVIGLTAAPTMFYFAVEGYHHTRNVKKYLFRLAIFAVISWFPYVYFINGGNLMDFNNQSFLDLNVIYTIFLGVLAIHIRRKLNNTIAKTILVLFLIMFSAPANWGYLGVIIILIFDYFYGSFKKQSFCYCAFVLLVVILTMNIQMSLINFFTEGTFNSDNLNIKGGVQQLGMLIPIILLYFYNGQRGKGGGFAKWFFYIYYPLHLLILGFFQTVL